MITKSMTLSSTRHSVVLLLVITPEHLFDRELATISAYIFIISAKIDPLGVWSFGSLGIPFLPNLLLASNQMMIDFWASFVPVFLESVRELFVEPCFTQTKVPQDFWILVILPQFSRKTFKRKEKKFRKMFGIWRHLPPSRVQPYPFIKNVQTQTTSTSFSKISDANMTPTF